MHLSSKAARSPSTPLLGTSVGCLIVKEAEVYEAFGDSLLSNEGLLALESSYVGSRDSTAWLTVLFVRTAASCTSQACAFFAVVVVVERIVIIDDSSEASTAAE
jgi:hypothetical protein